MTATLKAGQELDTLVAEKVMGWKVVDDPVNYRGVAINTPDGDMGDLPKFSTDIAAACEVGDKFDSFTFGRSGKLDPRTNGKRGVWACVIVKEGEFVAEYPVFLEGKYGIKNLAHAICIVALKAIGE